MGVRFKQTEVDTRSKFSRRLWTRRRMHPPVKPLHPSIHPFLAVFCEHALPIGDWGKHTFVRTDDGCSRPLKHSLFERRL
jgi:hypothetical protein